MVLRDMPAPRPVHVLRRGAYDAPLDRVDPGTPDRIFPFAADLPRNRKGLASWIASPRNPLTARVVVNRVWRTCFGRGLVATAENFGSQGQLPTHPELLDGLALDFVQSGWDLKRLFRQILTSSVFRQSSVPSREALEKDPENRLLARGPRRRLEAELIRDSALAASGLLCRTIGGRSVKPYQPPGLWEEAGTGKSYAQDHGAALYRRSLYTFWRRTAPPPSLLTFDATSREVCTAKRETTTTPLQALVLLNDPQYVEAARVLAERLIREGPSAPAERIAQAFRIVEGRTPSAAESSILLDLYGEQRSLFARDPKAADEFRRAGEARIDETLNAVDAAATTVLVSALFNLDEFITLR
jgi:hypothetical protein